MARKIQVLLEDDIDGTPGAETVLFSLDGKSYEIDLSEKNADALREAFAPWIGAGRRVSGPTVAETRRRPARRSEDTADIRRWAAENGIPVIHPRPHLGRPSGPLRGRPLGVMRIRRRPALRRGSVRRRLIPEGYGARPDGCCLHVRLLPPGAWATA